MLNGIVNRHSRARIILSHAGGFVPYAAHRFAELARVFRPDAAMPADILASFQRFYFDTALSSSPAALPSLMAFAEDGHIVFGTDFPFAPASVASSFIQKLDAYEFVAEERSSINRGNALSLFERLRVKDDDLTLLRLLQAKRQNCSERIAAFCQTNRGSLYQHAAAAKHKA